MYISIFSLCINRERVGGVHRCVCGVEEYTCSQLREYPVWMYNWQRERQYDTQYLCLNVCVGVQLKKEKQRRNVSVFWYLGMQDQAHTLDISQVCVCVLERGERVRERKKDSWSVRESECEKVSVRERER